MSGLSRSAVSSMAATGIGSVRMRSPCGFDELQALPAFGEGQAGRLLDCLALLLYSGQVLALVGPDNVDVRPAQRFNRMVVERARAGRLYGYLASPVARTGVPVDEYGFLGPRAGFARNG